MGRLTSNRDCLMGGCDAWFQAKHIGGDGYIEKCWRCGFNVLEAARRRQIPLTPCKDGLSRKIIPKKPPYNSAEEVQDG